MWDTVDTTLNTKTIGGRVRATIPLTTRDPNRREAAFQDIQQLYQNQDEEGRRCLFEVVLCVLQRSLDGDYGSALPR